MKHDNCITSAYPGIAVDEYQPRGALQAFLRCCPGWQLLLMGEQEHKKGKKPQSISILIT